MKWRAMGADGHVMAGELKFAVSAVPAPSVATAPVLPLIDGELRKIDVSQRKITVRHGAIPNLDMAAMTMLFLVKYPAWL